MALTSEPEISSRCKYLKSDQGKYLICVCGLDWMPVNPSVHSNVIT